MGNNPSLVKEITEVIEKREEDERREQQQSLMYESQNMDALDKELNNLLDSYSQQIQASTMTNSNAKEHRNFYVADFTDGAYYTEDHIGAKGAFKDAPQRAMNISINDGQWLYDKVSCSQACKDHQYFGLQDVDSNGMSQCFCSDSLSETTKYGADDCGEGGGPWCNYVYENVKPPPIPSALHLGKLYYGEKGVKDDKFTIYEYPTNQIDFTGQTANVEIKFFKIAGFDSSPGQYDMTSKPFFSVNEAKEYCLEIKATGFVHDRATNNYYFKSATFPQAKKVASDSHDIYFVYPAIKNVEPCNKHVEIVSPNFIKENCVIKSGIPPSNVCDGLDDTDALDINARLMTMGNTLASNMEKNMANADKYINEQPEQREKYRKTLDKYKRAISIIHKQNYDIETENAISEDAIKNVKMREMFIYLILVIAGTIAIIYLFGYSRTLILVLLVVYYIGLYVLVAMKDA